MAALDINDFAVALRAHLAERVDRARRAMEVQLKTAEKRRKVTSVEPAGLLKSDGPMRSLIVAVLITGFYFPTVAQPMSQTAQSLLNACQVIAKDAKPTQEDAIQVGICLGELEALNWLAPGQEDPRLRSCVPGSTSMAQIAGAVIGYLDQNPGRLGEPFEGLALEAMAQTWPCPRQKHWFDKWLN